MPWPDAAIPPCSPWCGKTFCVFARSGSPFPSEVARHLPRRVHAIVASCTAWPLAGRLALHGPLLAFLAAPLTNVDIHPGATIGRRFFIDHGAGVVIGKPPKSATTSPCTTASLGGTTWNKGKRHPTLADGVVVGAGAKILGPSASGAGPRRRQFGGGP